MIHRFTGLTDDEGLHLLSGRVVPRRPARRVDGPAVGVHDVLRGGALAAHLAQGGGSRPAGTRGLQGPRSWTTNKQQINIINDLLHCTFGGPPRT